MEPTQELIDDIYRRKVLAARAMSPIEKLLAGPRMFEEVQARMLAGIAMKHPEANDERRREILAEWIRRLRKLDEHGIYRPVETNP